MEPARKKKKRGPKSKRRCPDFFPEKDWCKGCLKNAAKGNNKEGCKGVLPDAPPATVPPSLPLPRVPPEITARTRSQPQFYSQCPKDLLSMLGKRQYNLQHRASASKALRESGMLSPHDNLPGNQHYMTGILKMGPPPPL